MRRCRDVKRGVGRYTDVRKGEGRCRDGRKDVGRCMNVRKICMEKGKSKEMTKIS